MKLVTKSSIWTPVHLTRTIRKYTEKPLHVKIHGQPLSVFWHNDGPKIVDDICKHRGASLSAGGIIDLEKGCVKCKYHGQNVYPNTWEVLDQDGIIWLKTGNGELPSDEQKPPTSWEFHEEHMRVFDYSRDFSGCNPILTLENTLDWSHLDTVHLFHLIEGKPDVSIQNDGYHGKALYKYKSKVIKLSIENEYISAWSSCLRFIVDNEHAFTIHFAIVPHDMHNSNLLVRVSRPSNTWKIADIIYLLVNELPLWEDRFVVRNADPSVWSVNKLTLEDAFLKKYRGYILQNHSDIVDAYVR